MNNRMYRHPAVQANLALLADRGVTVIGPGTGDLASHGEHGVGRMSEPAELLAAVEARLAEAARPLERWPGWGCTVLVTAGGTREPIDSVRYIGNRSSGRMGFALAARARPAAAPRSRWSPPTSRCPRPPGVNVVPVETAAELKARLRRALRPHRRPADGRRGRGLPPARPGRPQAQEGQPARRASSSNPPKTC